ncbi:AVAST type 3 anti-phage protein Avs3b [Sorangium sp. So ce269]
MTERSARSEAVIALGKKLVAELGLSDSADTLGRWMAHHIAELVQQTEEATDDCRTAKQAQLRDAILALWTHRFELPTGKRPFGEFEPILRALASLDPESQSSRYFSPRLVPDDESDESKEAMEWLSLAITIDGVSKVLINHCLTLASDATIDKSKEWVRLAKEAGIDDSFDFGVVDFFKDQSDLLKGPDPNAYQRRILTDRKTKLEAFLSAASTLANDINARLNSL